MGYMIDTVEDVEKFDLEALVHLLKADELNKRFGRDLNINPTLGLELVYTEPEPIGYVCSG